MSTQKQIIFLREGDGPKLDDEKSVAEPT